MSELGWGILGLIVWLLLCLAAGFIAAWVTRPAIPKWYVTLRRPWYTPPNWVFGPVWTVLYVLMAVAAWQVWLEVDRRWGQPPLLLFYGQLVLNAGWSVLFFGLRSPRYGLVGILVLWALVSLCMAWFARIDPVAGWLLLPYWLWLIYAGLLNWGIYRLNRSIEAERQPADASGR